MTYKAYQMPECLSQYCPQLKIPVTNPSSDPCPTAQRPQTTNTAAQMDDPAKSAAPSICQLPCPSCPFCLINLKSNPSLAPLSHPASTLLFGSVSFPPVTMQSRPSLAHSLTMAPQCPWKEAQDFLHNTQDPARISSLLSRSDSVLTLNRTPFAKGPVLCLACQLLICTCYPST